MELYKLHRPKRLKKLVGQPDAVKTIQSWGDTRIPHAVLLTGPSGVGKTTIARILKRRLECADPDFHEKNCADFRGIDMVRDVRTRMSLSPTSGKCMMWLIDECHRLTGEAQDAFLKILEDTPKHVYFILATTDPNKLKATVTGRCTPIRLKPIGNQDMLEILKDALEIYGQSHHVKSQEVFDKIIDVAGGSARAALVLLDKVLNIEDEDEQLSSIQAADLKEQAVNLCRALISPKVKFAEVAKILKELGDEDPEGIRRLVLAWFTGMLLKGSMPDRCYYILNCFRDNYFDTGKAGLAISCYEACKG